MFAFIRGLSLPQLSILLAAGLLPVVHSSQLARSFRTPQLALLLLVFAILSGAAAVGSAGWILRQRLHTKIALAAAVASCFWLSISTVFGLDPLRSLVGHQGQSTGLLFWLMTSSLFVASVRWRDGIRTPILKVISGAALLLLILEILWFTRDQAVRELLVPTSAEGGPLPGVGNTAFLGAFFGVATIAAAALLQSSSSHWIHWISLAGSSMSLILTQARVGIAITFLTLGYLLIRVAAQSKRVAIGLTVGAVVIAAGATGQAFLVRQLRPPAAITDLLAEEPVEQGPVRKFDRHRVQTGLSLRRAIWSVSGRIVRSDPLIGTGPSNFSYEYRRNVRQREVLAVGNPATEVQDAHNLLVELAATSGVPGLIAFVVLILGAAAGVVERRPWRIEERALGSMALILFVSHMFQPLSLVATPLLAILAGTAIAGGEVPEDRVSPGLLRRSLAAAISVALVSVALIALISDRMYGKGALEWDRDALSKAIKLDPACQDCLYALGRVRGWDFKKLGAGTEDWAMEPLERAISLHPKDSDAYLRKGLALLFLNRDEDAVATLRTARSLDPFNSAIASAFVAALIKSDQSAEALPIAKLLVGLEPNATSYSLLAAAARRTGDVALATEAAEQARKLDPRGVTTFDPD